MGQNDQTVAVQVRCFVRGCRTRGPAIEYAGRLGETAAAAGLSRPTHLYGKGGAPNVVTWAYISPPLVT
jgi:hypothetical protein